ncbi:trichothecene c-15 hydroxylase [Paraphaeosphaeria sporulosa]
MGIFETVAILTATCLAVALFYGLYNLYLHPLRRYPGPSLYAAYRLPYVIANMRGRLAFEVLDMHRKYGPVVRIAPNELAFTEPEAWNDIYGLQGGRVQNPRDKAAYTPPVSDSFGEAKGIIHASDAGHARLRRIYGQAFTPKAIEGLNDMLLKYSNLLVEQLKIAIGTDPVQDLSAWFNYTTFDLTGDFAFGDAFHCLDSGGKSHFFLDTVLAGVVVGCQIWQLERYKLLTILSPLLSLFAGDEMKKAEMMGRYTQELVDARLKEGYQPDRKDVLNYLLQSKKKEDQLETAELYENALTLVVAGSETTATLLSGVVYFLCRHPAVLEKVQDEVRGSFKRDVEITPISVNGLKFMIAVLSETMRVFPPAGFGFPRIISSEHGQSVAGRWVPSQTRCNIFHYAAYRYEANFAQPEEFIPERWLVNAPAEFKNDKREVVQPFMVGPRGCIGKGLAYAEMRLILAKMLWHFDFELADPTKQWHERLRSFLIWERTPLRVRSRPVRR